ncbi:hypothetical protein K443DRAFT_209783 [Laccaria amethystina LaAM-08-1]|uniref:Uncharacterized protein n=1 Tax=Laccaria amethystina LaAM-08-1 TaxID=1095629 RepID=A0A0C9XLE3_9AGAR|nr:hypothetical protein K443DRAFT_209783 [Laccaria amethystina LaAM-08-1]
MKKIVWHNSRMSLQTLRGAFRSRKSPKKKVICKRLPGAYHVLRQMPAPPLDRKATAPSFERSCSQQLKRPVLPPLGPDRPDRLYSSLQYDGHTRREITLPPTVPWRETSTPTRITIASKHIFLHSQKEYI